jgi:uncharacterized protein
MRLSSFNLLVEDLPTPGEVLVNNTFSGAFAVLDRDTLGTLRRIDGGAPVPEELEELVAELADPDVGVLVASREAEEAEFLAWFERRRRALRRLDVIVGINLACNFACSYCSQATVLDGTVMSHGLIEETASWLADRAVATGLEEVHVTFVGGEPLLHVGRIEDLASQLRRRLRERLPDASLTLGVITNGYFLSEEVLDRLVPLGLRNAQVTLDGNRDTHCATRISKRGEDTFARVFDNVISASRRIRVRVNGNYQPETAHGFAPLVDELAAAGLPQGSPITFSPALEGLSSNEGAGTGSCTWRSADTAHQVALADYVLTRGYDPGGALNVVGPCELHDAHHFSIDSSGHIYKCPGFLGHSDWSIGHVASGLTARYDQLLAATPKQSCTGCAHRPNCGGGCLATEWLARGSTDGVNCASEYFAAVAPAALARQYALATSDVLEEAIARFPLAAELPSPPTDDRESRRRRPSALRVIAA